MISARVTVIVGMVVWFFEDENKAGGGDGGEEGDRDRV